MYRSSVLTLVSRSPAEAGVFESRTETSRVVPCYVKSVGVYENYTARSHGFKPEMVFGLSTPEEYQGEEILLFNSQRYHVIRVHETGSSIELTAERVDAHV